MHEKGSFIYLQLWALGRTARLEILTEDGHELVAPSPISAGEGYNTPRALTIPEIQEYIQWYAQAAKNAVEGAGFDGVEIHGANGYLIDQFLQDVTNQRTDVYGGSVEARSKFGLQVVDAVVKAIGQERTGLRVSPWGRFQSTFFVLKYYRNDVQKDSGMKMQDPIPQFSHFIGTIAQSYPNFAYLHVVEPAPGNPNESNDFLRRIWKPRAFISCGGYTAESAIERADKDPDELVAFGQWYISNVSFLFFFLPQSC